MAQAPATAIVELADSWVVTVGAATRTIPRDLTKASITDLKHIGRALSLTGSSKLTSRDDLGAFIARVTAALPSKSSKKSSPKSVKSRGDFPALEKSETKEDNAANKLYNRPSFEGVYVTGKSLQKIEREETKALHNMVRQLVPVVEPYTENTPAQKKAIVKQVADAIVTYMLNCQVVDEFTREESNLNDFMGFIDSALPPMPDIEVEEFKDAVKDEVMVLMERHLRTRPSIFQPAVGHKEVQEIVAATGIPRAVSEVIASYNTIRLPECKNQGIKIKFVAKSSDYRILDADGKLINTCDPDDSSHVFTYIIQVLMGYPLPEHLTRDELMTIWQAIVKKHSVK